MRKIFLHGHQATYMYVVGLVGSPREGGNTEDLVREALGVIEERGGSTRLIRVDDYEIAPCSACGTCAETHECSIDDDFESVFQEMRRADGIIAGSPTYFGSATPQIMSLLDRAGYVSRMGENVFKRKVGGPIAVARRAGHNFTYAQLLYWFLINGMIVPGSTYWNVSLARGRGDALQDREAVETIREFAENMAWLIKQTNQAD